MRILQVVDKTGSAIDILANFISRHNRQHEIDILPLHPKRPDEDTVNYLKAHWHTYDLIHWQYWKSWTKAREIDPGIDKAKSILTHHNPYDTKEMDWRVHDANVVMNKAQKEAIPYAKTIRHAVDENLWEWKPNDYKTVGMCANRIEDKKGVLEVAQVCKELGLKFIVMGRISKPDYWQEVLSTGADIEFHENVPFDQMPGIYHKMGVYVVNSVDNFETGPMPPVEAMLSGVPVVARPVGTLQEVFQDRENILFFDGAAEMKKRIEQAFEERDVLREKAWKEAKNLNSVRYARQYNLLYHEVMYPEPLVSVICPYTDERAETWQETYDSIKNQTYKNIEILMKIDDEEGYNLAKVRNEMIIQAHGEYILSLDDRWKLDPKAIGEMVKQHDNRDKVWVFGVKDKGMSRKDFVENFALTKRQDLIDAGMFNERIDCYGGQSQEVRVRFRRQGWEFKRCETALAYQKMGTRREGKKPSIMRAKQLLYKMGM